MFEMYGEIKKLIALQSDLDQQKLLSAAEFAKYCIDHGLSVITKNHIEMLWWAGLLQADRIVSNSLLEMQGLDVVQNDAQIYVYADNRQIPIKESWASSLAERAFGPNVRLYFHPFRLYAIYRVQRSFSYNLHSLQYLINKDGANTVVDLYNDALLASSTGEEFADGLASISNSIVLSVFCEPVAHQKVFSSIRWGPPDTEDSVRSKITTREVEVRKVLLRIGLDKLEDTRRNLCIHVEMIDPNTTLHIMLRMMNARMRQQLKGPIGGAMLLFSMAEYLRVCAEKVFQRELPEEDELGIGVWMKDVKKTVFGANRLYDAGGAVKREFFRQYGADHGTKVRCYFEGDTELGAFNSLLAISNKVDLINLKNSVVEKGGKGVAFRASLRDDLKNKVFSIVVIDVDRADYVRAVKKACQDDEICGRVFFLFPDFEFGNFSLNELIEILKRYASKNGADEKSLSRIENAVARCKSGKELERAARNSIPELADVGKGEGWGSVLMEYAMEEPHYPDEHSRNGRRDMVEAADILLRCVSGGISYITTRSKYRVDPDSGESIKRVDRG